MELLTEKCYYCDQKTCICFERKIVCQEFNANIEAYFISIGANFYNLITYLKRAKMLFEIEKFDHENFKRAFSDYSVQSLFVINAIQFAKTNIQSHKHYKYFDAKIAVNLSNSFWINFC